MKRQEPTPYPLTWPKNRPRAKARIPDTAFHRTAQAAMDVIYRELEKLRAAGFLISSNVIGLGRQSGKSDDPGVAVWFTYKGQQRSIAIDRYTTVRGNLCGIAITIESLRAIERHGGVDVFEQAMQGFDVAELPDRSSAPTHQAKRAWHEVLGVVPSVSRDVAEAAYRTLARGRHPDAPGGSKELFQELQSAISEARELIK